MCLLCNFSGMIINVYNETCEFVIKRVFLVICSFVSIHVPLLEQIDLLIDFRVTSILTQCMSYQNR